MYAVYFRKHRRTDFLLLYPRLHCVRRQLRACSTQAPTTRYPLSRESLPVSMNLLVSQAPRRSATMIRSGLSLSKMSTACFACSTALSKCRCWPVLLYSKENIIPSLSCRSAFAGSPWGGCNSCSLLLLDCILQISWIFCI